MLAMASVLLTGACTPTDDGVYHRACDITVDKPVLSGEVATFWAIMARSVSECDKMPITHVVHLTIERKLNGGWVPVADPLGNAASQHSEIPSPDHPVQAKWFVPCPVLGLGSYRTVALVTGENERGSF